MIPRRDIYLYYIYLYIMPSQKHFTRRALDYKQGKTRPASNTQKNREFSNILENEEEQFIDKPVVKTRVRRALDYVQSKFPGTRRSQKLSPLVIEEEESIPAELLDRYNNVFLRDDRLIRIRVYNPELWKRLLYQPNISLQDSLDIQDVIREHSKRQDSQSG